MSPFCDIVLASGPTAQVYRKRKNLLCCLGWGIVLDWATCTWSANFELVHPYEKKRSKIMHSVHHLFIINASLIALLGDHRQDGLTSDVCITILLVSDYHFVLLCRIKAVCIKKGSIIKRVTQTPFDIQTLCGHWASWMHSLVWQVLCWGGQRTNWRNNLNRFDRHAWQAVCWRTYILYWRR